MAIGLDILSSVFGLVGGLLLLFTAWKGAPLRRTIDVAEQLDPNGLLFDLAKEDAKAAKAQLAEIVAIEPNLIVWSALCLCASFLLALTKHAF
jgi:hypothetical protein